MTSSRTAVSVTLAVICLAATSVLTQRAGSIDTISPAAGRPGDLVTITGRGFGAINVRITVGGVPALVTAANGNLVRFRVPAGAPQGATRVTAINPGGQSGSIAFEIIEGVLLSGAPNVRATSAATDMPATPANRADIESGGLILTRLSVTISPDATVGQVNAALLLVQGGIVSMRPGDRELTFAIPRQAAFDGIARLIQILQGAPGIDFVFPARESSPNVLPGGAQSLGDQLFPTRFPAAWNAQRLATRDCSSRRVTIVVADNWPAAPPAKYSNFTTEIPSASFTPATTVGTDPHGYEVTATLAAMFNNSAPTGANPFVDCLDIRAINVAGIPIPDEIDTIVRNFPAGKFIVNYSEGYASDCQFAFDTTWQMFLCDAAWVKKNAATAFQRALLAGMWKRRTHARWRDFLATTSAGNANDPLTADGLLGWLYPGIASVLGTNYMSASTDADPFFGFAADHNLWDKQIADTRYDDLTATDAEMASLRATVVLDGLETIGAADNTIVVGSTTAGSVFGDLRESRFSNQFAHLLAVGENVLMLDGTVAAGTSFSAPQVAGLASYLWLLSDDLKNRPDAIAATRAAIDQNARNVTTASVPVIDAYASILSLDEATLPTPTTAPVRLAILDLDDNGRFDEADLQAYAAHLLDATGHPVAPSAPDYSRFDVNGDGFTGGTTRVESFDLDRVHSTQFGAAAAPVEVTQTIEGEEVHFDESSLTDAQILCYYAYSALYTGDPAGRAQRLTGLCGGSVSVTPAQATLSPGGTQQFAATVRGIGDPRVTWRTDAPGATITSAGLFTAGGTSGTFTVTATSVAEPTASGTAQVIITGSAPGHGSGELFANASGHAQFDPNCTDLAIESPDDVQSFSRSLHCFGQFTGKPPENLDFTASGDATTTFSETDLLGELTSATATGVYVTTATALGNHDPNLPPSQVDNTVSEAHGSYKLHFTVSRTRIVRLTGTLTGNDSSTFLQFGCGDVAFDHQAGAGPVDRTFTLQPGQFCSIEVESRARSRALPPPQIQSPTAGFDLHVDVH